MTLYQEEKNILLQSFLDRHCKPSDGVEFIISSECNQACEYCYLFKHGHELYPGDVNKKENVLRNFKLLLDYLYNNEYAFHSYDLFSGEFFQLSYWEEIFEIIYEHPSIELKEFGKGKIITIPTNFSFLLDAETTNKIETWIAKFKNDKQVGVFLSCSVDGPSTLEELERPIIGYPSIKQKDFYDKLFKFLQKHRYIPHPMITKNFVKNYKENYDFWIDNIIKYDCTFTRGSKEIYNIPMFLEVRDPDQWDTPEALENYRNFLFYVAEKDLQTYHNNDLREFAIHVADDFSEAMKGAGTYTKVQPYLIGLPDLHHKLPCSIQSGLHCRVGDLAIVPCHRTCYPNMLYGKFTLNEEKTAIIGVEGDKINLAHKIQTCNPNRSFLTCSDCEIKSFCIKGCIGSQYENTGELFGVQENVCNLFKVKYKTIHDICEKYGVYEIIKNDMEIPPERRRYIEYAREKISKL